ncbi:hypothetical protein Tco_0669912, partial [Tanacetum coccineum]
MEKRSGKKNGVQNAGEGCIPHALGEQRGRVCPPYTQTQTTSKAQSYTTVTEKLKKLLSRVPAQEKQNLLLKNIITKEHPRRTEALSESEGGVGGHWKSKSKRQKSSIEEDDLSQPW